MDQTRFRVEGMDCASCATKIDRAVRRVRGVEDVSVSVATGTMTVQHSDSSDLLLSVQQHVKQLGYSASVLADTEQPHTHAKTSSCCAGHHDHDHEEHQHKHTDEQPHDAPVDLHGHNHAAMTGTWWTSSKAKLTFYNLAALALAYGVGHLLPAYQGWIFTAALLVGLVPIARRAFMAARFGTIFSIEMLMTIAAVGAVIIGAQEEAATVVVLFLIGELLEGMAATKARASIQSLASLVPKTALLEDGASTRQIPAEDLVVGNVIVVRPGDRISADGTILSGESAIDEAPVTGESTPVRKGPDDAVFAGTVNADSVLRIKVTAAATDNTIARIIRLVEEAQESKAPTERFIDRFSTYYTPSVVLIAALVALVPPLFAAGDWAEWIYKGLAILLIGCPCALVISTPAAIAASLSAGARRGLLLKGGAVLERLGKINTVCFDKTGTLTEGKPVVTDVLAVSGDAEKVLRLSAALESGSNHPLAKAILSKAASEGVSVMQASEAKAVGGKGVLGTIDGMSLFLGSPIAAEERAGLTDGQRREIARLHAEGKTVSVLVIDGVVAGALAMRDEPREDAIAALRTLQNMGVETLMLTGDNNQTAKAIGADLGIDVRAELLPQDKQQIVAQLQGRGRIVAKVGDGINDAPALAAADIGIAMGGGADVALETADAAILHGRVSDVAEMILLSKRTMRNIGQNITIALGLKAVFLVTTLLGITGLWPAIMADTGATVLVTLNALRLLRA
ncbi:heavy metal translocating P-type ATPase [Allorhizobium terrae]|uniref:P-type Zn(2+) transporter n=1 Tax=Allorhizobium terrae TaxID=1848972 RepID=A0A4S4A1D6_9HYPH|nr:heavy metal translocating P-type ATPase [Allorhizobium terrae]THF52015.1 cadmium-translocating P-type ATPase [Allorhizobium terrae]